MFGKNAVACEAKIGDGLFERGVYVWCAQNSALVRRGGKIGAEDSVTFGSVCPYVFDATDQRFDRAGVSVDRFLVNALVAFAIFLIGNA